MAGCLSRNFERGTLMKSLDPDYQVDVQEHIILSGSALF